MRTVLLALVSVMTLTMGCTAAQAPPTEAPLTDDALQQKVKMRLQGNSNVARLNLDVTADAAHNAVQLKGLAYTQRQRTQAVELAGAAHPGVSVQDAIEVKPYEIPRELFDDEMMTDVRADAGKMGDELGDILDDGWVHMKVVAKLLADSGVSERTINVDVKEGLVTLRGNVKTRDGRQRAETVAKGVDGVKAVRNRLTLKP